MAALMTTASVHKKADREQRHIPRLSMLMLAALVVVTSALFGCGGGVYFDGCAAVGRRSGGNGNSDPGMDRADDQCGWNAAHHLAGYKVYYGTTPGVYTSLVVGDVNSYQIVGLTKGQTYYFTVTAYDTNGNESDLRRSYSKLIS